EGDPGYDLPIPLHGFYNLREIQDRHRQLLANLGGGRRLLMDGDGNVTAEQDMGPGEVRTYRASRQEGFNAVCDLRAPTARPPVTRSGGMPLCRLPGRQGDESRLRGPGIGVIADWPVAGRSCDGQRNLVGRRTRRATGRRLKG